jgi:polyisoprenoid-binding protein YceI
VASTLTLRLRYAIQQSSEKESPVMKLVLPVTVLTLAAGVAAADPVTYQIDPNHTYPSFGADHFNGMSTWRGKFDHTSGTIVLDRAKGTGTVDVTIDTTSINFGMPKLDEHVKSAEMLDVAKYPTATYKGTLVGFKNGSPTQVQGQFTLHGVTRPLNLTLESFKCMTYPDNKEHCGADAAATFNRADYGVNYGDKYGFKMEVKLDIQVEAARS